MENMVIQRQALSSLRTILAELRPYRNYVLILIVAMIAKTAFDTSIPVMLYPVFNQFAGGVLPVENSGVGLSAGGHSLKFLNGLISSVQGILGIESSLTVSLILVVLLAICKSMMATIYYFMMYYVQSTYERDKREQLFAGYTKTKWLFFINQKTGNTMNLIFGECNKAGLCFLNCIALIDSFVLVAAYLIGATYMSPLTTVIAAVTFGILALVIRPVALLARRYGRRLIDARQALMHHLGELLNAFKVVKGCRMEEAGLRMVEKQTRLTRRYTIRTGLLKYLPFSLLEPLILLVVFGMVLLIQAYQFADIAASAIIGLFLYRSFQKVSDLQRLWINISEDLPSVALVSSTPVLLEENREERPQGTLEKFDHLQFLDVSFQYPGTQQPALNGINLDIRQGDFVGIVGSSGAGKTTFVDMTLGLLEPTGGEIIVNQIPLREIDPWHWRSRIGYVAQESILFNDTVMNNIALYRKDISEEDIRWAVRIADAEEFVLALPQGYQTPVGDRGAKLSGGQRQRLALARALVHRPQILLLDEATSSLDSLSEKKIQQAVEGLRGQMTILVIAHRLSTVINAGTIVVLDQGRIKEMGVPGDLLKSPGRFSEMYSLQTTQSSF